jgi:hypothetical protein
MKNNYEDLDKSLNIESSIVEVEKTITPIDIIPTQNNDIKKDYEYTRANLYSLIEKGQEAINGIMELAGDGGSPRAYEVAGQLIKSVADTTDKLIDLQKKLKDVQEDNTKVSNNVTNNAVFVGSTSELSKLLKQGFLNNKGINHIWQMGSLRKWFKGSKSVDGKPGWVEVISGEPCAREEGEEDETPKCVSSDKRASMTKSERISAQRRKSAADPNQPEKSGAAKPTYVSTDKPKKKMNEESDVKGKGSGTKDACYTKVKSRYSVWPSAYASGALVKCRKVGAANWGNKSESINLSSKDSISEEMGMRYCPKCEKDETRDVCRYGPKYWDMFSLPSRLSPNQMKFSIAQVHPANESKEPDHEYSMARSELSTIISAAKRLRGKLKGEGNIEAWVQSKITKAADYIDAAADYLDSGEHNVQGSMDEACWKGYKKKGMKTMFGKRYPNCVKIKESNDEYSNWREDFGLNEASAAWQRKAGKNPEGGLNAKGVASYRAQNPGSKLQTAVTTKPSKLKPGSKDAKRRKSFCARMGGNPGPMKDEKGRPTRKALSLRKWNC